MTMRQGFMLDLKLPKTNGLFIIGTNIDAIESRVFYVFKIISNQIER